MIKGAVTLILVMSATQAGAQTSKQIEARYSAQYDECMSTGDAANGVTSGIMDCNGAEIERQDARLNQAYTMVMLALNPVQKSELRTGERARIAQRDAKCHRAAAPEEGGSIAGIIYSGCILDETIKRSMWLETYRR